MYLPSGPKYFIVCFHYPLVSNICDVEIWHEGKTKSEKF